MNITLKNLTSIMEPHHHEHDHDHDHFHVHDHDHDHDDDLAHNHIAHSHLDQHDGKENIILAKLITMFTLFFLSTLFGLLPFKFTRQMQQNSSNKLIISTLLSFGGGVLLCTTFVHLLPEVNENIEGLHLNGKLNGELLMCCGFFIIYLIEELVHRYIRHFEKSEHGKNSSSNNNNNDPFIRGLNVRESVILKRSSCMAKGGAGDEEKGAVPNLQARCNSTVSTLQLIDMIEDNQNEKTGNGVTPSPLGTYDQDQHQLTASSTSSIISTNPITSSVGNNSVRVATTGESHRSELHSHGNVDSATLVTSLRGLLIVLALSIHELFEGLAIGLERATTDVWYMFGAVAAHKLVIAFCIGVELCVQKTKLHLAIIYVIIFAIVSPIGIGIGILLSNSSETYTLNLVSVILQGLATGTLLYVIFFEILTKERSGLVQYLAIVIGFFLMFGLQFLTGHEHSHHHHHSHSHGTNGTEEHSETHNHADHDDRR